MNLEKLESKQDVERVVDRIIKMTSRHSAFGLTDNTDIKSSLMAQLMQVVSQTKHRVQQKIDKNIWDLETHSDNSDKQSKIMITCSVRIAKQGNSVQVRYPVIKSFVSTEINEHTLVYPKMNENSMNMKILKIKSKHIKPESVSKQIEVKAESSLKQQWEYATLTILSYVLFSISIYLILFLSSS